jgi:hypothetical protein
VTQPLLFAVEDGEHSAVTEGGIIVPADAADCPSRDYDEERKRGDIAEYRCAIELTFRGYVCTVVGGNCEGYDIIANRRDIRPQFVQVKHGFLRGEPTQQRYRISNGTKTGGVYRAYSANAYDILAFYMWERDQWLIYGRAEFGNRTTAGYTPPDLRRKARSSIGAYGELIADRQPNNWELFDQLAMANSQESLGLPPPMSDPLCQNPPIP